MAHLRMLQKKFVRKQIDWTERAGRLSPLETIESGCGFAQKWAWLLKIRAQQYIRTPLLEILDPPLATVEVYSTGIVMIALLIKYLQWHHIAGIIIISNLFFFLYDNLCISMQGTHKIVQKKH